MRSRNSTATSYSPAADTVSDFEDFLLGLPSQYNQSQLQPFYGRNKYLGVYAQDGWRVRSNLTLNYGLRWDRIEPWYEKNNGISTFEPGKQSLVFPGAPAGILFPTDPGVPRTLAPPGNLDFAPRIGLAYSPEGTEDTLLGKILGGPGKTSVRAGFGMYYTAIEALTVGILAGNAPFGITYSSPAPPLFATPFITASTGQNQGQPFPVALVTQKASSSHPDSNINWSQYEPISGIPGYAAANRIPYVEEYMLSLERQVGSEYGAQAPATWDAVAPASRDGGSQSWQSRALPESESAERCRAGFPDVRSFRREQSVHNNLGPDHQRNPGPVGFEFRKRHEADNNWEVELQRAPSQPAPHQRTAGTVWPVTRSVSRWIESSNLGEEVNPINPALSYALSSFDVRHNFVVSYNYRIPFESLFRCLKPLDAGMGSFRNHPFQHWTSRDARQLRRQFSARGRTERHQQLWR